MRGLSDDAAKECALALVHGTKLSEWTADGLQFTNSAAAAFRKVGLATLVEPLPGSRKSPSGADLDLYAQSPWNALCAVLFQDIRSRLHRGSFHAAFDDVGRNFGGRPFYRGQARAWDIMPSAWRSQSQAELSERLVPMFCDALQEHFAAAPDPVMHLAGRSDLSHATVGLAQHYGLPTNMVDFTFHPLVAMCFACGMTTSPEVYPRDLHLDRLRRCAVIYVIAAPALSSVARTTFEFPPSYSLRLYQQKGLFADFGRYPCSDPAHCLDGYTAEWTWLQQNCQRIFFPRTYPVIEGADELRDNHLMEGDEFLIEVARRVKDGIAAGPSRLGQSPPWAFDESNMEQYGKRAAAMAFRVDAYLRRACLIKFEEDDKFDPLLVGLLRGHVAPELASVGLLAEQTSQPGLLWTRQRLSEAYDSLSRLELVCFEARSRPNPNSWEGQL